MEEVVKKITQILDQLRLEAVQVWPLAQFVIPSVKSMILSELKKLEEKKDGTDGSNSM